MKSVDRNVDDRYGRHRDVAGDKNRPSLGFRTDATQLNHYRILGPLGKGGMEEMFAAGDARPRRRVAIKVLTDLPHSNTERRWRFDGDAKNDPVLWFPRAFNDFVKVSIIPAISFRSTIRSNDRGSDTVLRSSVVDDHVLCGRRAASTNEARPCKSFK